MYRLSLYLSVEMNSSEDFQQDLTEYFIRLEKGEEYFSYAIELIAGLWIK